MASSGNFASINFQAQSTISQVDQNETNLTFNGSSLSPGNYNGGVVCDFGMNGGKWYWELYLHGGGTPAGARDWSVGFAPYATCSKTTDEGTYGQDLGNGSSATLSGYSFTHVNGSSTGIRHNNSTDTSAGLADHTSGDILGFALDLEAGTWIIYRNGSSLGTVATGIDTSLTYFAAVGASGGTVSDFDVTCNFGQDSTFKGAVSAGGNSDANGFGDFKYSVPSGYLACCSGNLEISADIDPAKTDTEFPEKQHGVITYTGTGSSNSVTGLGFQPDLVIIKNRDGTQGTKITDSSRGVTKVLQAPSSSAESTDANGLTAFGSDGFTVGSDAGYNGSGNGMVAWCWKANGGTTVTNNDGSITSTVQANTKAGFSIVQFTGINSATTATVGHGLGKAPTFIIHKRLNGTGYHFVRGVPGMTNASTVRDFNPNGSPTDISGSGGALVAPTTTTFNINNYTGVGGGGSTYVAYCWAPIAGYSDYGSYTANGNNDGPYIYTGFRPKTILTFGEAYGRENFIWDTVRTPNNPNDDYLRWGRSSAEGSSSTVAIDFYSNGFKIRGNNADYNGADTTVLYMAWADTPWKYNNAL